MNTRAHHTFRTCPVAETVVFTLVVDTLRTTLSSSIRASVVRIIASSATLGGTIAANGVRVANCSAPVITQMSCDEAAVLVRCYAVVMSRVWRAPLGRDAPCRGSPTPPSAFKPMTSNCYSPGSFEARWFKCVPTMPPSLVSLMQGACVRV